MKIGTLEMKIARVEGFQVRVQTPDGRDVRSDREGMPPWTWEKAARDNWSVARWKHYADVLFPVLERFPSSSLEMTPGELQ